MQHRLLFLSTVLSFSLLALLLAPSGAAQPQHLRFERLSVNEGLSSSLVYAIR